jgi:hypothetical protein
VASVVVLSAPVTFFPLRRWPLSHKPSTSIVVCFHCGRPGSYDSHGHRNPWTEEELGGSASSDELKADSGYYDPKKLAAKTSWREESSELVPGCIHGPIECENCWNARTRSRSQHEQPSGGPPPFSKNEPVESAADDQSGDGWWSVLDEAQP